MTGAMRQAARAAIDQRRRELVAARLEPRCPTCGGDRSSTTAGCKTCWARVRNRKRRDDPVFDGFASKGAIFSPSPSLDLRRIVRVADRPDDEDGDE